jgi:thioredoxin reductase
MNAVPETLDYVIVGAGPAGLQMGHHLQRAGRRYAILEAADAPGAFFKHQPRHRTLISINKRHNPYPEPDYNLRHDWNSLLSDDPELLFGRYSDELFPHADDLVRYLADYAERLDLDVRLKRPVTRIARVDGGGLEVHDAAGGRYACRRVLVATGAVAPRIPEVPGIELALGYEDHPLDPEYYTGKRVAILGRGNSAFEVANHLAGHAALIHLLVREPVRHAWNTHYPGDLRAINNTILDMYQLKSLHATLGLRVTGLSRRDDGRIDLSFEDDFAHWDVPGTGKGTVVYDEVIRATGWRYVDQRLFDGDDIEVDARGKYPALSPMWESSMPGVHFIGTAMGGRDRRAASGFIHGFRYNVRALHHVLEREDHDVPLPVDVLPYGSEDDLDALAVQLIERVSTTTGLYQQFAGVLTDAIVLRDGEAHVYRELPGDWILSASGLAEEEHLILLTFEYSFHRYPPGANPLDFIHPGDPANTQCAAFIHPVFRRYRHGEAVDELHLPESLVVRYDVTDYEEHIPDRFRNKVKNFLNGVERLTSARYSEAFAPPEALPRIFRPWSRQRQRAAHAQALEPASECRYVPEQTPAPIE